MEEREIGIRNDAIHARLEHHKHFQAAAASGTENGIFYKRSIIGGNSPINGGIHVGVVPQEALVIDEKYSELSMIYTQVVVEFVKLHGKEAGREYEMLPSIFDFVSAKLRYSETGVNELNRRKCVADDKKVALDLYIEHEIGVARHQVLLAGYLIERALKRKLIHGDLQIDTHYPLDQPQRERLIFTCRNGRIFLFDPVRIQASKSHPELVAA